MRPLLLPVLLAACTPDYGLGARYLEPPERPDPPELGPQQVEDVLGQRIPPRVDVLWVIDNSNSMLKEQQGIADNSAAFIEKYEGSGLDWHIGVVSTDMANPDESGKLQGGGGFRWVDPSVPDPVAVFQAMSVLGRDGSTHEKGRAAVYAALEDPAAIAANDGFFREDALLSIIIVSDENDDSHDRPTLEQFEAWLLELKPDPSLLSLAAVVQTREICEEVDGSCVVVDGCSCGLNEQGTEYLDLMEDMNGIVYDINEDEWTPVLERLADVGTGLSRTFYLSRVPVPSSIGVSVVDDARTFEFTSDDWTYDPVPNAITFTSYTPRANARVHVTYEVLGSTSLQ